MTSKYEEFPIIAPYRLITLCEHWHNGQASAMYSVLSTGRIVNREILVSLSCELSRLARDITREENEDDYDTVVHYEQLADKILENFPE